MAQPIFEKLHLAVSSECGDDVSAYTSDGEVVTKVRREAEINNAIGDVYARYLGQMGVDAFMKAYPEFKGRITFSSHSGSPNYVKPASVRSIINGYALTTIPAIDAIIQPLNPNNYFESLYNPDSEAKPSTSEPKLYEEGSNIRVEIGGGAAISAGTIVFVVLLTPEYVVTNASLADVIMPYPLWFKEVVEIATLKCMSKIQEE